MENKRPSIASIPDDFKNSSYDICASWKLENWAAALFIRMDARLHWRLACLEGKSDRVPIHMMNSIKSRAQGLLQNPTPNALGVNKCVSPICNQSALDVFIDASQLDSPAYSKWADRYTCAQFHNFDDPDKPNDAAFEEEMRIEIETITNTAAWEMHRNAARSTDIFFISVDLGMPNDYLVAEFKSWLKTIRREAKIETIRRPYDATDFHSWHQQRLLPYLDLKFWAETHKKQITNEQIGLALFGTDSGDGNSSDLSSPEHIRRTLAPTALGIVSEEVVSALHAQIRKQAAAVSSKTTKS